MTDEERIEEAHGLWEIAVVRLAAISAVAFTGDGRVDKTLWENARDEECRAFGVWQRVSDEACLHPMREVKT